jgi:endonuclease/exonuclease/phosphatase family metal-dependent hydrolase
LRFLKKILLFTNILAALSLVAGGLSIYINPSQQWLFSFFGLFYPLLLLINVFFLFLWIVVRFKYALLPLAAILITYPVLSSYFSFHLPSKRNAPAGGWKIMSYNVRNFDVYHWSKEKDALNQIIKKVKAEKPAIACFQEFYAADSGKYQTIAKMKKEGGMPFFHFEKKYTSKTDRSWGTAIFSRYPIINTGAIMFSNQTQNSCSYADIKIDTVIVRVFNIHLQSVYFSKQDYQYLHDISENQEVQVAPTKQIVSKLKKAFILRGQQALKIEAAIEDSPYPVIVCGDFNDTPASFSYHTLSKKLNDAFLLAGWGTGATYAGFPTNYRIDYIFTGKNFEVAHYRTTCVNYSDHRPITCEVRLKAE